MEASLTSAATEALEETKKVFAGAAMPIELQTETGKRQRSFAG